MTIEQAATDDDRWESYLWPSEKSPGRTMLRNLYGLHDEDELRRREYRETTKRALEIHLDRVDIPRTGDLREWQAIHAHLFGNVYEWAGQLRDVPLGKGLRTFLAPELFNAYIPTVLDDIRSIEWHSLDRLAFIELTAQVYASLNWAHPFREGNGRASRLFLDRQIEDASWKLDYSRIEPAVWNAASRESRPALYGAPSHYPLLPVFAQITIHRTATVLGVDPIDPRDLDTVLERYRPTPGHDTGQAVAAAGLDTTTSGSATFDDDLSASSPSPPPHTYRSSSAADTTN
ncbi:Fic family protein [Nocardia abscessus]|uniref:Fic/DOC family protein n=1 Tax=Nocardia abscessus TaxID=120957 RepID=UPI0018963354|nr:Fic family protein [Nocardia abscessus]MBF6341627.1 Fic family protein [Nocardia abscessus]